MIPKLISIMAVWDEQNMIAALLKVLKILSMNI